MSHEKQGKYESLRELYPEFVSLDQLHKVCGIAKRSAKYLVDNGIIPYHDTGRKTWKYKIYIGDVSRSILDYSVDSKAALAYKDFASEVVGHGK